MKTKKQLFLTLFATLALLLTTACSDDDDDNGNKNDASVTDNDSAVTDDSAATDDDSAVTDDDSAVADNDSAVADSAVTNDTAPPAKTCQPDCEGDSANCAALAATGRTICADSGACVFCKTDGDCTVMAFPKCVGGACLPRQCTGDTNCTAGPRNTGLCNTDLGQCWRCETDQQCEAANLGKQCLGNACAPCKVNSDCTNDLGCDTAIGECVVCDSSDNKCLAPTSKCVNDRCVRCETSADCTPGLLTTAICVAGKCAGCDDNTECSAAFNLEIFGPHLCK